MAFKSLAGVFSKNRDEYIKELDTDYKALLKTKDRQKELDTERQVNRELTAKNMEAQKARAAAEAKAAEAEAKAEEERKAKEEAEKVAEELAAKDMENQEKLATKEAEMAALREQLMQLMRQQVQVLSSVMEGIELEEVVGGLGKGSW